MSFGDLRVSRNSDDNKLVLVSYAEIADRLDHAKVAILIITPAFLGSKFCLHEEYLFYSSGLVAGISSTCRFSPSYGCDALRCGPRTAKR